MSRYTLIGPDGLPRASARPGTLGGHRRSKVYGRLDCPGALRWIAKGHYVKHRVFFADEATALAAGYRPCGHCLRERYREFRAGEMTVRLDARAPFDHEYVLDFLARRAVPGVEAVDGTLYSRDGFDLTIDRAGATLSARVDINDAVRRARRILDLDANPSAIAKVLRKDPVLPFRRGIRSPGAYDAHEVAVRAIVGQQVSVAGARTTLAKLAARDLFPRKDELARAQPDDLPMPRTRAQALIDLANDHPLEEIKGVGPWTLAYVRMRTGDPDVFLPTDLVVRQALDRLGGTTDDVERWRPFRSYAVHLLWAAAR